MRRTRRVDWPRALTLISGLPRGQLPADFENDVQLPSFSLYSSIETLAQLEYWLIRRPERPLSSFRTGRELSASLLVPGHLVLVKSSSIRAWSAILRL